MRTLCTALAGLVLAACGSDEKSVGPSDAGLEAPRPDVSIDAKGQADAGPPDVNASDAEAGSETGVEPKSDASDGSPEEAGDELDGGTVGPSVWLAFTLRARPPGQVWATRVRKGLVSSPVLLSSSGSTVHGVRILRWTPDGRQLVHELNDLRDLFVIDMSGSVPGPVRRLTPAGTGYPIAPEYSPDGRYLAYFSATNQLTVVDLREQQLTNRSVEFCPSACPPASRPITPPRFARWTGDSQWIYAHDHGSVIWGVRVVNGTPQPPLILANYANTLQGFGDVYPSPLGTRGAVILGDRPLTDASLLEAGTSYLGMVTPTSFEVVTGGTDLTSFWKWLSNGEFVYDGVPPDAGSAPQGYYLGNSLLWTRGAYYNTMRHPKFAPDLRTLSYLQHDGTYTLMSLYLRRRLDPASPSDPQWSEPILTFTDYVDSYEWAPDSRHVMYINGARLHLLDTAGPELAAPREIESGGVGRDIAWGRTSNRIFYTSSSGGLGDLKYIDAREAPRAPAVLTPTFTHKPLFDTLRWSVSPEDAYVAYTSDFTRPGEHGLYITNVAGSAPEAPRRVDKPAVRDDDEYSGISLFEWQPVVRAP